MGSRINTILIIGATSGIGEAFARRFHSDGKKVIITGRRADRLAALQNELPGIGTRKVRMFRKKRGRNQNKLLTVARPCLVGFVRYCRPRATCI